MKAVRTAFASSGCQERNEQVPVETGASRIGDMAVKKCFLACLLIGSTVPLTGCTPGHDQNALSMSRQRLLLIALAV